MLSRSRIAFLLRVALGMPVVARAGWLGLLLACSALGGAAAALVTSAAIPPGDTPFAVAASGIAGATASAGAAHALLLRRTRKRLSAEFARLARRLGEEKTSRAELRAGLRRLASALDGAIPLITPGDESRPRSPLAREGTNPRAPGISWREGRLRRLARACSLLGGTDLDLKRIALAGPCAEVIEEYRRIVGSDYEILYIEDGGSKWLAAPIDRPLFLLLLRELLDNVIAHARPWSRITVTTEPIPGAIVMRVRDNGCGGERSSGGGMGGAAPHCPEDGLGLLLARTIVEAHGGSFRIEAERGQGTVVSLHFPTHA